MPLVVYSVKEARERLRELTGHHYSDQALRKRMKSGALTALKIGNLTVLTEDELHRFGAAISQAVE